MRKIADARLQDIAESLCQRVTNVSGKKTQQRDIASIGLKTVIAEVSGSQAQPLVTCTTPLLVDGLSKPVSMQIHLNTAQEDFTHAAIDLFVAV